MKRIILYIIPIITLFSLNIEAQVRTYPYTVLQYPFIKYEYNKIDFPADSNTYDLFLDKLNKLVVKGEGRLQILQIGGSHIQADIYSNETRQRLQNFYPGLNGGRGFVFPFAVAKTNNPVNLKVKWIGNWTSVRNIQKKKNSETLGLAGISVTTSDSVASLKMYSYKGYHHYDFNRVKLFYKMDSLHHSITIADSSLVDSVYTDSLFQYTEYFLNQYIDTINIKILKKDTVNSSFTFYGALMETDDPGVVYHSIGINGASIPSFLRCQLFEQQLHIVAPDLVILSLGTNDAYGKTFSSEVYFNNYDLLIQRIISANPKVAIMITVPNDDYIHKRYPNRFTAEQEIVIYKLAKKYNAGVWDLYKMMGGFNSSQTWYEYGLMKYDRIHFTKEGYLLKGDLFFNAILRMYDHYIDENNRINKKESKASLLDLETKKQ